MPTKRTDRNRAVSRYLSTFDGTPELVAHLRAAIPNRSTVCICDHFAPLPSVFCSVNYLEDLARAYIALGLSSPGCVNWAVDMLQNHRSGRLYGLSDDEIDPDSEDSNGEAIIVRLFKDDSRREMNRFLDRAKRRFRNVLKDKEPLRSRLVLLDHAMRIARCLIDGRCAARRFEVR